MRHGLLSARAILAAMLGGPVLTTAASAQPQRPAVTWDFETGDMSGWTAGGPAFTVQPASGNRSRTVGYQGRFRIATDAPVDAATPLGARAVRDLARLALRREMAVDSVRGVPVDSAGVGTLVSPAFPIRPVVLRFLIGGSAAPGTRVELVLVPTGDDVGSEVVLRAQGPASDTMRTVAWDLRPWVGRTGRILVVDESMRPGEYIAADDFRFEDPGQVPPETPDRVALIPVPRLLGMTPEEVERTLDGSGLELVRVESRPSTEREGTVVDQAPPPDTLVAPGTPVAVVLASPMPPPGPERRPEPEMVPVPYVIGYRPAPARDAVQRAGLVYRVGSRRWSLEASGTVLAQVPGASEPAPPGSVVVVTQARQIPVVPLGGGVLLLAALPFAVARVRRVRRGTPERPPGPGPLPSGLRITPRPGDVRVGLDPSRGPPGIALELRVRVIRGALEVRLHGPPSMIAEEHRHG